MSERYQSFKEFYPYYLSEHSNRTCRILHFMGTSCGLFFLYQAITTGSLWWIPAGLAQAYAFAWVGHFFIEKNRPATFTYPVWSFMGDWVMWWGMLRGKHWNPGASQP